MIFIYRKNIKKFFSILLTFISISLIFSEYLGADFTSRPSPFQGTVKINDNYADEGLIVEAYINGVKKGETTTYFSGGKTWYVIDVVNGSNGNIVRFKINGSWANEEGIYNNEVDYINLNLTVTTNVSSTTTTTTTITTTATQQTTTTTTIREITVSMPTVTTTTLLVNVSVTTTTSPFNKTNLSTTTIQLTEVVTTTTLNKENRSKITFVIPPSHNSSRNYPISSLITIILVILAFFIGYYAQKIKI